MWKWLKTQFVFRYISRWVVSYYMKFAGNLFHKLYHKLQWVSGASNYFRFFPIYSNLLPKLPPTDSQKSKIVLTLCADFLCLNKFGAPPWGWGAIDCGSGFCTGCTVWMGRGGFWANFFNVVIRFSHINVKSSIRWSTCNEELQECGFVKLYLM